MQSYNISDWHIFRCDMFYSILMVSGKPTLQPELINTLDEPAFKTEEVADFFEAFSIMSDSKPDMVVMNVELPLIDGWEACHWMRQTFGVPIILLGRETSANAWSKTVQAGADFYLKAPFSCLELSARIKAILRRYTNN